MSLLLILDISMLTVLALLINAALYYCLKKDVLSKLQLENRECVLLISILILGVYARLLAFSGFYGSDDGAYAYLAKEVANNEFKIGSGTSIFNLRIGLFVPVAMGFKAFGFNELVMLMYPFALSLISIIIAFIAGKTFFNFRAGLIAATIQALLPIDVRSASMLLPDLPAAVWSNIGVMLLYFGVKSESSQSKVYYGIISGLSLCLSWFCKEIVVYLLPCIFIYISWSIYHQKRNLMLLYGLVLTIFVILLSESLVYYKYTHDFMFRFHAVEKNYEIGKAWFFAEGSRYGWSQGNYFTAVAQRLFIYGPKAIFLNQNFAFVTVIAIIGVCYAAIKKIRAFIMPSLWFISLLLAFNFASSSLRTYRPLVLFDRYMYPLLLPALLIVSGFLDMLLPSRIRIKQVTSRDIFLSGWLGVTVYAIIIYIAVSAISGYSRSGAQSKVERTISRKLTADDKIYTDSRTASALHFFWKYPKKNQTYNFEGMSGAEIPAGTYVLINRERVEFLNSVYGYILPKFYKNIPKNWQIEWQGSRSELYTVSGKMGGMEK